MLHTLMSVHRKMCFHTVSVHRTTYGLHVLSYSVSVHRTTYGLHVLSYSGVVEQS